MFVRAFEISSPGVPREEAVALLRERALPDLRSHEGFQEAMVLTSQEDEAILLLSFWDSEENLRGAPARLADAESPGLGPDGERAARTYELAFRNAQSTSGDALRATVAATQTGLDTRLAFENRQQGQRYVTKAVLRLSEPDAHGVQIEARGQFIDRVEVWPTGQATALMSVEEQLGLPTLGVVRINNPSAKAYDVTVYTTAPDSVELSVALVGNGA